MVGVSPGGKVMRRVTVRGRRWQRRVVVLVVVMVRQRLLLLMLLVRVVMMPVLPRIRRCGRW